MRQPESGHFAWTSPLGRAYHIRPQPITTDLVDPVPRPEYAGYAPSATIDEDGPIFYRPPPAPDSPSSPARVIDLDEPPPF
ncbi:MAG: hypothetical protein ACRDSP_00610 [Pseudonocardiaceae bacterium]